MMKIKAACFGSLLLFSLQAIAQEGMKSIPMATVHVVVTNKKNEPRKGEVVLFAAENAKKQFATTTGQNGKATIELPVGDIYGILLKTLNDSTQYYSLQIPALEEGEFFDSPFTVNIKYEPARSFTLNNVHFDFGKPTLRPDSFKELDLIAEYMLIKETGNYEIAGHTDSIGRHEDNMKLSLARAGSVKAYLVKKGVDASRVVARGYGATIPVADNATAEGRQLNRRTVVVVL